MNIYNKVRLKYPSMPLSLVSKVISCPVIKVKNLPLETKVNRAVIATIRHCLTNYDAHMWMMDEHLEDKQAYRRRLRPFIEQTIELYKCNFKKANIQNILYKASIEELWSLLNKKDKEDIVFCFHRKYNGQFPFLVDRNISYEEFLKVYKPPKNEYKVKYQSTYLLKLIIEILVLRYIKIKPKNKYDTYELVSVSKKFNPYINLKTVEKRF